jgi:hypothetical protein
VVGNEGMGASRLPTLARTPTRLTPVGALVADGQRLPSAHSGSISDSDEMLVLRGTQERRQSAARLARLPRSDILDRDA